MIKRKIRFRGKRTDKDKWIYGDLLSPTELFSGYEISDCNTIDGSRYDIDEDTIGQYTGLKDKNGKEIYEGDILNFELYNGEVENYYIAFRNACFEAINKDDTNFISEELWKTREVIGNVYDNPELLEG